MLQIYRLVKIGKKHMEDAQKLLGLMGIPFIKSPTEAESQCAALQKGGKVFLCLFICLFCIK